MIPASTARTTLSVRSWRTSRPRPAPSAARRATRSRDRARHQQVGHVGAGDEQQQRGQPRKGHRGDTEERADVRIRPRMRLGDDDQRNALVGLRILTGQRRGFYFQGGACLQQRHARLQSSEYPHLVALATLEERADGGVAGQFVVHPQRHARRRSDQ